jgi:hypothetical protein
MEPVSADLLLAAASGLGDAAGRRLWQELCHLVRGSIRHSGSPVGPAEQAGAAEQMSALEQHPGDRDLAARLAQQLTARTAADADFRRELTAWVAGARQFYAPRGRVHNEISGGTFHQPVLQVGIINQVD